MSRHIILYIEYFSFCYSRYSPFPSQGCHGNQFSFMKRKKKNMLLLLFSSVLFSVSFFSSPFLPLHVFVAMVSCRVVKVWQSSHMLSFVLPVSLTSPLTISVGQHTREGTRLAGFTKHVHTDILHFTLMALTNQGTHTFSLFYVLFSCFCVLWHCVFCGWTPHCKSNN